MASTNGLLSSSNRREYSRVNAHLPLGVRLVPDDEKEGIWAKISGQQASEAGPLPDVRDEALAGWLAALNRKLDLILDALAQQAEGFSCLPMRQVNISGGGLSFASREPFRPGNTLEIKTVLPLPSPVSLYVYGEVVSVDHREELYDIGVKFVAMNDEIREEICKFVFHRERQILREKRR